MSGSSHPSSSFALEVKSLSKSYGSFPGVWDVNLTVEKGTLHGFLGPNGSGKTTTMKCIMGLLHKTSGVIKVFGEEPHGDAIQVKQRVGYLPETPSFPTYLRGREVLMTYGRLRSVSNEDKLLEESKSLLRLVGLDPASEKPVGKYSRGMQSRLGLAFALLGSPDLLLLDEPTAGLDPIAVIELRETFKRLVSEGCTILLSSHQLSEVQQTCCIVTVVNEGKTVAEGSVEDLTRRLHGGITYKVEFSSLNQDLLNSLMKTDGVSEIVKIKDRVIRIRVSKDYDIRPNLAKSAVEYGSLLLSCEKEETSLEELFVGLVKETG